MYMYARDDHEHECHVESRRPFTILVCHAPGNAHATHMWLHRHATSDFFFYTKVIFDLVSVRAKCVHLSVYLNESTAGVLDTDR